MHWVDEKVKREKQDMHPSEETHSKCHGQGGALVPWCLVAHPHQDLNRRHGDHHIQPGLQPDQHPNPHSTFKKTKRQSPISKQIRVSQHMTRIVSDKG